MAAALTGYAVSMQPQCEQPIDVRSDAGTTRLCDAESHRAALARVDALLVAHPDVEPGTPAGDALEALIVRIHEYEEQEQPNGR
jgi:hypothetical protein